MLTWIWLEQALAAEGKTGDFYDGKRAAARYFFTYELPKTAAQFAMLASMDRSGTAEDLTARQVLASMKRPQTLRCHVV